MFQLLSAPFAYQNKAVSENALSSRDWIGNVDQADIAQWMDAFMLLLFGGIPWQVHCTVDGRFYVALIWRNSMAGTRFLLKPQNKVYFSL
jgi:hypothetical protein